MRANDIVGRRIRGVVQECCTDNSNTRVWHVSQIVFEDGSSLTFHVAELAGDYAVLGTFHPARASVLRDAPPADD